jgi:hypothetical protein
MEIWSKVMETGFTPPVDIYPFFHWVPEQYLGNWVCRAKRVGKEMNALYSAMLDSVIKRRETILREYKQVEVEVFSKYQSWRLLVM